MANHFRVVESVEILPGAKVLKAADVATVVDAQNILSEAEVMKAKIIAEAQEHYKSELERGYREGTEKAAVEKANAINGATLKTAEFSKRMESYIGDIVQSILTKVLGHFDKKELVFQLVESTLKDYTKSQKIRVSVNPEYVDYFNDHIGRLIDNHSVIEFIEVIPDYSVEDSGCVLDAQSEMIFMSIEDQLKAIKEMMQHVVPASSSSS